MVNCCQRHKGEGPYAKGPSSVAYFIYPFVKRPLEEHSQRIQPLRCLRIHQGQIRGAKLPLLIADVARIMGTVVFWSLRHPKAFNPSPAPRISQKCITGSSPRSPIDSPWSLLEMPPAPAVATLHARVACALTSKAA
jgi:hypothetical protein